MDKGRKVMTNVWAMQGFIGSATHRMFKAYWDLNEATKGHMSDQDIREALVKSLNLDLVKNPKSEELKKFVGIKFRDIISDEAINNMVFRCKELHNKIKDQFRGDITIMAEQSIAVEIPDFINPDAGNINLIGNIDLVVITDSGDTHIIDYKTSPKKYELYNDVKRRTFSYQLATYQRMLQAMKLSISPTSGLFVVPIVFDKFDINTSVDFDDTDQEQLKNLVSFTAKTLWLSSFLNIKTSPSFTSNFSASKWNSALPSNTYTKASLSDTCQSSISSFFSATVTSKAPSFSNNIFFSSFLPFSKSTKSFNFKTL